MAVSYLGFGSLGFIAIMHPQSQDLSIRYEFMKAIVTKSVFILYATVALWSTSRLNPWDQESLRSKKSWVQAGLAISAIVSVYFTALKIWITCERNTLGSRRIVHGIFFILDLGFFFTLLIYVLTEVRLLACISISMKCLVILLQYVILHFGFSGRFKVTNHYRQLRFCLTKVSLNETPCWDPHPDFVDFEDHANPGNPRETDSGLETHATERPATPYSFGNRQQRVYPRQPTPMPSQFQTSTSIPPNPQVHPLHTSTVASRRPPIQLAPLRLTNNPDSPEQQVGTPAGTPSPLLHTQATPVRVLRYPITRNSSNLPVSPRAGPEDKRAMAYLVSQ